MMNRTPTEAAANLKREKGCTAAWALLALAAFLLAGCKTVPLAPVNLSEGGWKLQEGQAVWQTESKGPELAGELQVATRPGGETFVQFSKPPLPIVVAQTTGTHWQIQFVPENRGYSAPGRPPARLIWLHLPQCLAGAPPPKGWTMERKGDDGWRFENKTTGEVLEGWLAP